MHFVTLVSALAALQAVSAHRLTPSPVVPECNATAPTATTTQVVSNIMDHIRCLAVCRKPTRECSTGEWPNRLRQSPYEYTTVLPTADATNHCTATVKAHRHAPCGWACNSCRPTVNTEKPARATQIPDSSTTLDEVQARHVVPTVTLAA